MSSRYAHLRTLRPRPAYPAHQASSCSSPQTSRPGSSLLRSWARASTRHVPIAPCMAQPEPISRSAYCSSPGRGLCTALQVRASVRPATYSEPFRALNCCSRYPIASPEVTLCVLWLVRSQCADRRPRQPQQHRRRQVQGTHPSRALPLPPRCAVLSAYTALLQHVYSNGHVSPRPCPSRSSDQNHVQICASILGHEWSPVLGVASVCITLQSMLASCKVCRSPSLPSPPYTQIALAIVHRSGNGTSTLRDEVQP